MNTWKQRLLVILLSISIATAMLYSFKKYWLAYYNEYYGNHSYLLPKGKKIVVAVEPSRVKYLETSPFFRKLLNAAFPEYEIIFDNDAVEPDLIVRNESIFSHESKVRNDKIIPYITISGEPYSLHIGKYKWYGLPLAELISTTPKNEREIYFPFIGWSEVKIIPERQSNLQTAKKNILYVSSNCIKEREELFALLKQKKSLIVEAFGACSNPSGQRAAGDFKTLNNLYAQYQFVFAMENCQREGYITEKIVNVFNSGAIPIYWGDTPTVNKLFNPQAFVNVADFKSFSEAADYIEKLSQDFERMQFMHQQPIFKDNIQSPLLELDSPNNPYLLAQAKKLRDLYDKYLAKHARK